MKRTNISNSINDLDYGSRVLTDNLARKSEIEYLSNLTKSSERTDKGNVKQTPGVSVIIPSYKGADRIEKCLRSLAEQTLDTALFEVIVIINGPEDETFSIVRSMTRLFDVGQLRVIQRSLASAGGARNIGLTAARHTYVTMVDDDDYVGPQFLEALFENAQPNVITVAPIINVHEDGTLDAESALNQKILKRLGRSFKFSTAPELVGFNACKLIPLAAIRDSRYDEDLKSGEDICFMAEIAASTDLDAVVVSENPDTAYYRHLRADSISRQELNFDFGVRQRLAVIGVLEGLLGRTIPARERLVNDLINSQSNFVGRYLRENPSERSKVELAIESAGISDFPWNRINKGRARDLAISYCFAPYGDTSAVVAAKAIVERGKIVDVISNDISAVRNLDPNMRSIAGKFIENSIEIDAPPSFAGWVQISEFVQKGIRHADRLDSQNGGYETVYSRVLWAGSHFLAALFKLRHPATIWTAEFSDPMSFDAEGLPRAGKIVRDELWATFQTGIRSLGYSGPSSDSIFEWCEYITYVLADEIIFTNSNQLEYMISKVSDKKLREVIRRKSIVRIHPAPPKRSYQVVETDYALSPNVLNIGYFGAFYNNRSLSELMIALVNSPTKIRNKTRVHIFTNKREEYEKEVASYGLTGIVKVQSYRPYLEFLNLVTKFDVLLVNDVVSGPLLEINPFLPSKYSDYKGSGVPVWALVEDGSALSSQPCEYVSVVGNSAHALKSLVEIYSDWENIPAETLEDAI